MGSSLTSPVLIDGMDVMAGILIPGGAQRRVVTRSTNSDETYKWAQQNVDPTMHSTTIAAALALCTSGRNDIVLLSPDTHSQAAILTWNKNMTHLIGAYGPSVTAMMSQITHSVTADPLFNITGYGCTFANIQFLYGLNNATDLTAVKVTGNKNSFIRCHINAPNHTAPADVATFKLLHFTETAASDGLDHYFNHCTIGNQSIAWTNGDMMKTAGIPRMVFEDCMFIMNADNAQVTFIDGTASDGAGFVIFKDCVMHNFGTTLTLAIGSTGIHANMDYLLSGKTTIGGATDVIAGADEAKVFLPAAVGVTEDVYAGLSINPDHT